MKTLLNFMLKAALLITACTVIASAQASRTWVSGVGDDANPCSRTAPCKTFAGAISKTAVTGEINCLDPGGFGAVTITKAITIDCTDIFGSVLVSGTNGIVVAAPNTDTVTLRNIEVNGIGTGLTGILFTSGAALHLEHVRVYNFTTACISAATSTSAVMTVHDSLATSCGSSGGISLTSSSGNVQAEIEKVQVSGSPLGVNGKTGSYAYIRNCNFSLDSVGVGQSTAGSTMMVSGSQFGGDAVGVQSNTGSSMALYGNQFAGNGTAINLAGGTILSDGQSAVFANSANGTVSGVSPKL
jgi:hypothetical protein